MTNLDWLGWHSRACRRWRANMRYEDALVSFPFHPCEPCDFLIGWKCDCTMEWLMSWLIKRARNLYIWQEREYEQRQTKTISLKREYNVSWPHECTNGLDRKTWMKNEAVNDWMVDTLAEWKVCINKQGDLITTEICKITLVQCYPTGQWSWSFKYWSIDWLMVVRSSSNRSIIWLSHKWRSVWSRTVRLTGSSVAIVRYWTHYKQLILTVWISAVAMWSIIQLSTDPVDDQLDGSSNGWYVLRGWLSRHN